ncbi:MAG: bifunctional oligoribonuclease/PAP phosphatase NrnA [Synergistaceae bacterium]|nr:bifunctional oligoribonuclease/PAP phosphatase NrnA [Synergistaceae bacterium]
MSGGNAFDEALEKLKSCDSWVIVGHESPDGDTLGCAFALYSLGRRSGKRVSIVSKDPLPDIFSFMPHAEELRVLSALPPEEVKGALLITADVSTEKRTLDNLPLLLESCADSLNIDHHADNTRFAATNLVKPEASATAEIVTRLIEAYGSGVSEGEANALYVALVTDNGNFRYNSTSAESHKCAAILLEAGAKPAEIDDRINENMSESIIKLWGTAFSRTELFAGGKCALFWLRASEIAASGADPNSLDGLVNMLMRIRGVKIALFLTERSDGVNKLSVRSRPPYSSRDIAAAFGGGGHINAAGAKLPGSLEKALENVKKEAVSHAALRHTPAQ